MARRIRGEQDDSPVVLETPKSWVLCSPVLLDQEIVTIQRQGLLLAAFRPTEDGRLMVSAYHMLDSRSLAMIHSAALHPGPDGKVSMRENNWEYLKDASAGMRHMYAADAGSPYLSYWRHELGINDDGTTRLSWYRQKEVTPVSPSLVATQLSVHWNFTEKLQ